MYFAFSAGQVSLWKLAQWLQVSEAYSMIETLASGLPSQTSPSGLATPGSVWAEAPWLARSGERAKAAEPINTWRRLVMRKILWRVGRCGP